MTALDLGLGAGCVLHHLDTDIVLHRAEEAEKVCPDRKSYPDRKRDDDN